MTDTSASQHTEERQQPFQQTPARLRLYEQAGGTLAYTAAGWLDLLAGNASNAGNPLVALITVVLLAGGTVLLLRALLLPPDTPSHLSNRPCAAQRVIRPLMLSALVLCAVVTLALAANLLINSGDPGIYDSDAAAFNQYNAELVLHGNNPYTADAAFWDALAQFPSVGATPLRAGRYAGSIYGPTLKQVVADTQFERTHPQARGPEYDPSSLHSYPALAFLVYVPAVWAGLPTTVLTSLLALLAFCVAASWGAPRKLQPVVWLLLAASSLVVFWTLRGSFEIVALLPALLAWRLLDHNPAFAPSKLLRPSLQSKLRFARNRRFGGTPGWLSPLLLGLACAVKQLIWPLVPLYLILIWKREGPRAAFSRLAITLGAFLVPNLPFLLAAPAAWARSMLLPVTLPIFPSGVGLVGLARAGLLPLLPPTAYAALAQAALVLVAVWLARTRREVPPALVLILGLLPFALSWHSLFTYFMCIPMLAIAGTLFPFLRPRIAPSPVVATSDTTVAETPISPEPVR